MQDAKSIYEKLNEEIDKVEIHMNRNTQLALKYQSHDLSSMDIEPNFDEFKYNGIRIVVNDNLDDGEVMIAKRG